MKKKAYMAPEVEVHTMAVQKMICGSGINSTGGDAGVGVSDDDTEPEGGGDARRYDCWGDEEDF